MLNPKEIAEAFSGHKFESTYDVLADDIVWNNVGGDQYQGKAATVEACNTAAQHMADVTTVFTTFRSFAGDDFAVVDSQADYTDESGEKTTVASCDIYTFSDGKLATITSYNIELS